MTIVERNFYALNELLGQLEARIAEVETTQNLLIARGRRARAETEIRTTLAGLDDGALAAPTERVLKAG
jgi:phage shock protein A